MTQAAEIRPDTRPAGTAARLALLPAALALLTLLALLPLLAACSEPDHPAYLPQFSENASANATVYSFAPHPLMNPQKLAEVYGAVVDLLNQRLAADHISLKLEASRSYAAFNQKLLRRQVHFALPNPYQAVLSEACGYTIFGKMDRDDDFRGVIVLRKDSPITTVLGLKGATMSFPAPTALAATMMPELFLQEHGVHPRRDIRQIFVGTHDSALMSVCVGASAAACTTAIAWKAFQRERPELAAVLEVRWRTETMPNNALIVRNDVPDDVRRKVAQALFDLKATSGGQRILHQVSFSGFVPADSATFEPVRSFIHRYEAAVRPLKGLNE